MKKIIISLLTLILCGCTCNKSDALKFKEEYENLNGVMNNNGSVYITVNIDKDNPFKYSTYEEIMNVLGGTGIIYLGFPECPWCRTALPILLEASKEYNVKTIYYFNALSMRDTKVLENDVIKTTKEGTKEYYDLVDKLYDFLGVYKGLNDSTIKRIYFPTVIFVKNGEIKGLHVSTVSSQKDVNIPLTDIEKEELKNTYISYIQEVVNTSCDGGC